MYIFYQAEYGIRDFHVTGVQTCALPILTASGRTSGSPESAGCGESPQSIRKGTAPGRAASGSVSRHSSSGPPGTCRRIGRASPGSEARLVGKGSVYGSSTHQCKDTLEMT